MAIEPRPLFPDAGFGAMIEAPDALPADWLAEHAGLIAQWVRDYPALLIRGLGVGGDAGFAAAAAALLQQPMAYTYRSTPREAVADGVMTATEYPPDQHIPLHQENAYQRQWPMRLVFGCVTPPAGGGQTPLADMRCVTERLGAGTVGRLAQRGIRYVRTYQGGLDLDWRTVFQSADRQDVEAFCAEREISLEWLADDGLRTAQTCQAVARHPETGEILWFNQAHLFHPSALGEEVWQDMAAVFGPEGLPRRALYGDGAELEPDLLADIRAAYQAEARQFDWRAGDLLIIDNMRVAHGRRPYSGARRVLVSMGMPADANGLIEKGSA